MTSLWPKLRKAAHRLDLDVTKLAGPTREMLLHNWHLGFTCFGGPAVHFQIASALPSLTLRLLLNSLTRLQFREKFVEKYHWIDDQMVSYHCLALWISIHLQLANGYIHI